MYMISDYIKFRNMMRGRLGHSSLNKAGSGIMQVQAISSLPVGAEGRVPGARRLTRARPRSTRPSRGVAEGSAQARRAVESSLCLAGSFSSVKASSVSAGGSSTDTGCKVSQFEIVLLLIRCDRRSPAEFCGSHLCCCRIAGVKRHISWSSRGCLARSCA